MLEIYTSIMLAVGCTLWLLVLMTSYSVYIYRVRLNKDLNKRITESKKELYEAVEKYRKRLEKVGASKVRQTR